MRRLEGPELEAYDLVPHELARRVRVMQVPFLPNHADGMTVGTWIFVRNDDDTSGNRALLAHELVHVRQFAEQGRARFLVRYVREYLRRRWTSCGHRQAYLDITAEVEAAVRRPHGSIVAAQLPAEPPATSTAVTRVIRRRR